MKKLFTLILAVLLPLVINAAEEIDAIWYNFEGSNASVTFRDYNYNSYSGDVVIPETVTYNGKIYRVTGIGDNAFQDCTTLTSITIPRSVTAIGSWSFYNCTGLKSVFITDLAAWCNLSFFMSNDNPLFYAGRLFLNGQEIRDLVIPQSVISIGNYTFCGCINLTSVNIPEGVTSIGDYAFGDCYFIQSSFVNNSSLTSDINWGATLCEKETSDGMLINGDEVIKCRNWATSITIPEGVKNIAGWAFYSKSNLTSITIPEGVTGIGYAAFYGCTGLSSVNIPNSVTSLGASAFRDCTALKTVTIGNGVTKIDEYTFCDCTALTSAIIGNSVKSIEFNAFFRCTNLASVNIPEGVTSIAGQAFNGCTSLNSITIPKSVTSIGSNSFYGCYFLPSSFINNSSLTSNNNWGATFYDKETTDGLLISGDVVIKCKPWATSVTIPEGITSLGNTSFWDCYNLKSVTITEGVTSIGSQTFCNCTRLISVTIPSSMTKIAGWAFQNCNSLSEVHVADITAWCNITFSTYDSNPLNNADMYLNGHKITDLEIPESVTSISKYAFSGCRSLKSISIPNSVTRISNYSFYNCRNLTSVEMPESVKEIEGYTFSGCRSLTSITIPESVTGIHSSAFSGCSSLPYITIPSGVTFINNYAFAGCSSLTSINIPEGVSAISHNTFRDCSNLTSIIIPNSVTTLDEYAFYNCTSLNSIVISESVTYIGRYAFQYCTNLSDVYCYAVNIPQGDYFYSMFDGSSHNTATLHVPQSALDSYKAKTPWSEFGKIVALTDDDVTPLYEIAGDSATPIYYDLSGRKIANGQWSAPKGLYIRNGKKVLVK